MLTTGDFVWSVFVYLRMPVRSWAATFHLQSTDDVWERSQPDFRPTGRHVCVFAERRVNRWRRCSCWSCPLYIHTGHELDCSRHWPVHVCPAVSVDRVHWSPVDWCWPAVQSVPLTTTDVTVNHIWRCWRWVLISVYLRRATANRLEQKSGMIDLPRQL